MYKTEGCEPWKSYDFASDINKGFVALTTMECLVNDRAYGNKGSFENSPQPAGLVVILQFQIENTHGHQPMTTVRLDLQI